MNVDINQIRRIYDKLQDDLSREIFWGRVMYSATEDNFYMQQIVDRTMKQFPWVLDIRKALLDCQSTERKIVLDGWGHWGGCLYNLNQDIRWACISDKTTNVKNAPNIPILERKMAAKQFSDGIFVITSKAYHEDIKNELLELGIEEKNIINFGRAVAENDVQYYDVFLFGEQEIVVDGGCYDGGSILNYIKHANAKYKEIYSFEPEQELYQRCLKKISEKQIKDCKIVNKGLWSDERELSFCVRETGGSRISDSGDQVINTCSLDCFFGEADDKPTFIKMDIEGAELEALKGAKKIIESQAPKLAICVYHKPEDIWEIPNLILEYNSNYKFYLRHYSPYHTETVLYAICN